LFSNAKEDFIAFKNLQQNESFVACFILGEKSEVNRTMGTAWMNLDSYSLFFQQKRWSAPGTSCFVHVETLHKVEQQDGTRTYTTQIVWSNIPWIPAATQQ
jgi:hypothetical protein